MRPFLAATFSPRRGATLAGMIHLSVAIGRFVEALLWAIARVAGGLAAAVIGVAVAGLVVFLAARWMLGRRG